MKDALTALSALAQETRLGVFRALIQAGPDGLPAGEIARALGVRANTLSSHLALLTQAGLIRPSRDGRTIRYGVEIEAMRQLLGYLMQDCCGGRPDICAPVMAEMTCR